MPEIKKLLEEGHTVTLPLKGNSMRPYLVHMRDKALLERPKGIKVGDVVLAEVQPQHYVLHRIISIDDNNVTLRGDGNYGIERCTKENILAIATGYYRKGSTRMDSATAPTYKLYTWIWMHTFRYRRYLLKLHDIFFHSLKDLSK